MFLGFRCQRRKVFVGVAWCLGAALMFMSQAWLAAAEPDAMARRPIWQP